MTQTTPEPPPSAFYNFVFETRYEIQTRIGPTLTQLMKELLKAKDREGFEVLGHEYFRYWDAINFATNNFRSCSESDLDITVIDLINQKRQLLHLIEIKKIDLIDPVYQSKLNVQKICGFRAIFKKNFLKKCPSSIKSPLVGS